MPIPKEKAREVLESIKEERGYEEALARYVQCWGIGIVGAEADPKLQSNPILLAPGESSQDSCLYCYLQEMVADQRVLKHKVDGVRVFYKIVGVVKPALIEAKWRVMIDIYSGFPNPTWLIDQADSNLINSTLKDLIYDFPPKIPGLGYRGFLIQGGESNDGTSGLRVFQKRIIRRLTVSIPPNTFRDVNGLEGVLTEMARSKGFNREADLISKAA